MHYKRHELLFKLVFCSIMAAFSIVLDKFLQIPVGMHYKFTLYGLPLMVTGIFFGSIPGLIAGAVTGIILQLTSEYGITPTSIFWALAPIAWGGVAGLINDLNKKDLNGWGITVIVISCSISALLLNTLAMIMEALIMNVEYYTSATIIAGLPPRVLSSLILIPIYIGILCGIYFPLKHRFIGHHKDNEIIEDEINN